MSSPERRADTPVHVSELLAASGHRTTGGRRRRRAESDAEAASEPPAVPPVARVRLPSIEPPPSETPPFDTPPFDTSWSTSWWPEESTEQRPEPRPAEPAPPPVWSDTPWSVPSWLDSPRDRRSDSEAVADAAATGPAEDLTAPLRTASPSESAVTEQLRVVAPVAEPEPETQPIRHGHGSTRVDKRELERQAVAEIDAGWTEEPAGGVEPNSGVEPNGGGPLPARSPLGEWGLVLGQLGLALGAGAALWFGFRYLWAELPILAFVLSAVVMVGLLAAVRVMRRSEDMVSTVLAVLAGLIVTLSPPVLTLTGS